MRNYLLVRDPERKRGNPWFQYLRWQWAQPPLEPLLSKPELLWNACMVMGSILASGILLLTFFMLAAGR